MPRPTDINDLRNQLIDAFELLKNDPRREHQVKEMSNAAGKIINLTKLQMIYALAHGEESDIPFMGATSGRPLKPAARLLTAGS